MKFLGVVVITAILVLYHCSFSVYQLAVLWTYGHSNFSEVEKTFIHTLLYPLHINISNYCPQGPNKSERTDFNIPNRNYPTPKFILDIKLGSENS